MVLPCYYTIYYFYRNTVVAMRTSKYTSTVCCQSLDLYELNVLATILGTVVSHSGKYKHTKWHKKKILDLSHTLRTIEM